MILTFFQISRETLLCVATQDLPFRCVETVAGHSGKKLYIQYMKRIARFLLDVLTASFIVSVIGLLIGLTGNGQNPVTKLMGSVGIIGLFICIKLIILHVVVVLIASISNSRQ